MKTERPLVIAAATGAVSEVVGIVKRPAEGLAHHQIIGLIDFGAGDNRLIADIASRLKVPLLAELDDVPDGADLAISGGNLKKRQDLIAAATSAGHRITTMIHADTTLGPWVEVGQGTVVSSGVRITGNVSIGAYCQLHTGAILSHDDVLGDQVVLSPSVTLCGGVTVGDGAVVFAGATVMPGVTIGAGATVGAGALVNRDVAAGSTVVGVPAKSLPSK